MSSSTKLAMVGSAAAATSPVVTPDSSDVHVWPGATGDGVAHGVGGRQAQDDDLDRHHRQQQREGQLHEEGAHQLSRVLAHHRLQRRGEEHAGG